MSQSNWSRRLVSLEICSGEGRFPIGSVFSLSAYCFASPTNSCTGIAWLAVVEAGCASLRHADDADASPSVTQTTTDLFTLATMHTAPARRRVAADRRGLGHLIEPGGYSFRDCHNDFDDLARSLGSCFQLIEERFQLVVPTAGIVLVQFHTRALEHYIQRRVGTPHLVPS